MAVMQKEAWFNLGVVAAAALAVAGLAPWLGSAALGGFGILGLLGLGVWLFRRRGRVLVDERDWEIRRRAMAWAYGVFWVVFVLASVGASLWYAEPGGVPVLAVQLSVWCGLMLVYAVMSVATLVQYAQGR